MGKIYDITYVGAGPATMFSVLTLLDNGYKGNICIIEKGESLKTRPKNEVISGVFGAGAFSDFKVTSALDVGGTIPGLEQNELDIFSEYLLNNLNRFNGGNEIISWGETGDFNTSGTDLKFNKHKTCHVGTDRGQYICYNIEKYISSKPNVDLITNTKVETISCVDGIYPVDDFDFLFVLNESIPTKKLVIATGQKDELPALCVEAFNLKSTPRAFQLGIRVEDTMNKQYEEIIKANYDFKFTKKYVLDNGVKAYVRTFCCNSGNAHTCAEKSPDGFTCFNGHAYKTPDPNNNSVNYGIICEVTGLNKYDEKHEQIKLIKEVNNYHTWEEDNFENGVVKPKRLLLNDLTPLIDKYPSEIVFVLNDFIRELSKIVDLSKAHYLYPEVKLSGVMPDLNFETFETRIPGLYMIGDAAITRGILKSSLTGYKFAKHISNSEGEC